MIKIAKKHDKTAKTKLFMPVCRVLLTQAFVKGMTSSRVFDPTTKSTATSGAAADVQDSSSSSNNNADMLQQLIGEILGGDVPGALNYLPSTLAARVHACGLLLSGGDLMSAAEEKSSSATSDDAGSSSSTDDELGEADGLEEDSLDEWMSITKRVRRRRGGSGSGSGGGGRARSKLSPRGRDPRFVIYDSIPEHAILLCDSASSTAKTVASAVAVLVVTVYLHCVWQHMQARSGAQ